MGIIQQLYKIINLGNKAGDDLARVKSVRFLNMTCFCGIFMFLVVLIYNIFFHMSASSFVFTILMLISMFVPLWLNSKFKTQLALYYLLVSLFVIIFLRSVFYGTELHYQYYLVPVVGMALLFFDNLLGNKKWVFVVISIPLWIFIEYYNSNHPPLFPLDYKTVNAIKIISDIKLLGLVIFMFIIYIRESSVQIKTISEQKKRLTIANEDLEQFAYIVSHDLKAPLKSIYKHVDVIQEKYNDGFDKDLKKMFGFITAKTKSMDKLVSSILDYSRTGESSGFVEECNVNELLLDVVNSINVPDNIKITLPKNLPLFKTDETQLGQIFSNFISNAVKYNDKEKGVIEITAQPEEPNYMCFEIKDNGMGIADDDIAKVFEVFETAHGTSREDSTGVGLAIVKKLIKLYNGKLGLESELGKGSTFWFTWPIKM